MQGSETSIRDYDAKVIETSICQMKDKHLIFRLFCKNMCIILCFRLTNLTKKYAMAVKELNHTICFWLITFLILTTKACNNGYENVELTQRSILIYIYILNLIVS